MATTVTIANGQSLSSAISLGGAMVAGIMMPADWDAADITFQASHDGLTYHDVYLDDDSELVVQAAADRFVLFSNISQFLGFGLGTYLKIRSGTSGTPVAQSAARDLKLIVIQ